jgi:hypothetical protein
MGSAAMAGCGSSGRASEEPAEKTAAMTRQEMIDRPTPLREEIDQVAPVRDQVLKNSGR